MKDKSNFDFLSMVIKLYIINHDKNNQNIKVVCRSAVLRKSVG
ncbi:hypothetical protein DWUX_266 [Desulfovibrio diazotrophicus]|nr:hypothetical protein DWUX_266 [Desulfovibrio diazotrophicus]